MKLSVIRIKCALETLCISSNSIKILFKRLIAHQGVELSLLQAYKASEPLPGHISMLSEPFPQNCTERARGAKAAFEMKV